MLFPQQWSLLKQTIAMPRHNYDRREIPIYLRLLSRKAPDPRADWSAAQKSRVSSAGWWWGHQVLFQSLEQAQYHGPPSSWQPPANASHHLCSTPRKAALTPRLWLWGVTAGGNIYRSQEPLQLTTDFLMALTTKAQTFATQQWLLSWT